MAIILTLGTDNGSYLSNGKPNIPFEMFKEKLDCQFYIAKGDQENIPGGLSTSLNMIEARKFLEVVGEFYWIDPGYGISWMIQHYVADAEKNNPDFCWYDVETATNSEGVQYSDKQITDATLAVMDAMRTQFPHKRHELYSRTDFIKSFCPGLIPHMVNMKRPGWAAYPDYGLDVYLKPLSQIRAGMMRRCINLLAPPPRPYIEINVHDEGQAPGMSLFPNYEGWIWQTGSRLKPCNEDGTLLAAPFNHLYDWDWWLGSIESLKRWVRFEDEPVEPPPYVPPTNAELDARLKTVEAEQAKIMALPWYRQNIPFIIK